MYQEPLPGPKKIEYLGKIVGVLNAERTFVSYRRPEHIFRKFNGLGMSHGLLILLRNTYNCKKIVLILQHEDGTQTIHTATPEMFLEQGQYWRDNVADTQHILSFAVMNQKKLTELMRDE